MSNELEDWQQRVIEERANLENMIILLNRFIATSTTYRGLGEDGSHMLLQQLEIMRLYSQKLTDRICAFK